MEISKTIKFVGPFNQQLIKKLFPIFLILNVLLLPLKIFFSSSFLTQIISTFLTLGTYACFLFFSQLSMEVIAEKFIMNSIFFLSKKLFKLSNETHVISKFLKNFFFK